MAIPPHHVIARSEATWQSPGTQFVPAIRIDGCYQEIPTARGGLGMTYYIVKSSILCHCEERSDVAISWQNVGTSTVNCPSLCGQHKKGIPLQDN